MLNSQVGALGKDRIRGSKDIHFERVPSPQPLWRPRTKKKCIRRGETCWRDLVQSVGTGKTVEATLNEQFQYNVGPIRLKTQERRGHRSDIVNWPRFEREPHREHKTTMGVILFGSSGATSVTPDASGFQNQNVPGF